MASAHEIILSVERIKVGHGQRIMGDSVSNRAPDVDDPDPRLKEAVSIISEMITHSSDAGGVCLVDVNAFLTYKSAITFRVDSHLLTTGPRVIGVFAS